MEPTLPADVETALDEYLRLLGPSLPGMLYGIYLTGSVALDDWRAGHSDLDILTVTSRRLDDADIDELAAVHAELVGEPHRDAIYLAREDVGGRPSADGPGHPYAVDGQFKRDGYQVDPVLWATLHRHGVTVSGPSANTLCPAPDPQWLRSWNLENLDTYWRSWSAEARSRLSEREAEAPVPGYPMVWAVLGPGRLHCTIATGDVISKTAAADYTARLWPEHAELLARAKAWRLSGDGERADTPTFTVADGLAGCDLIDAVADDAARL